MFIVLKPITGEIFTPQKPQAKNFHIGHGTNYFRLLTFGILQVNICFPSYLFTVCAIIAKNTGLSNFEVNYKADVPWE